MLSRLLFSLFCRSPVVGISPKRLTPFLAFACLQQHPFAPPALPGFFATMGLSDSHWSSARGYLFPLAVAFSTPEGLPSSSTSPSMSAVPYHPGKPIGCVFPFLYRWLQASSTSTVWPLSLLCNEAVLGSLALRLSCSSFKGFAVWDCSHLRLIDYLVNG